MNGWNGDKQQDSRVLTEQTDRKELSTQASSFYFTNILDSSAAMFQDAWRFHKLTIQGKLSLKWCFHVPHKTAEQKSRSQKAGSASL